MNLALLEATQYQACVGEGDLGIHGRVERPCTVTQIVRPDELVELDVVHMAAAAELGRVHTVKT